MFVSMTIHEASMQLRFQLFHIYDEREADNISELVMENITGWKKIDRVVNKTVPLTQEQEKILEAYTKLLLDHQPLQYVLHEAWFYGMLLYTDKNVLIPRPETEELVDWLIKDANKSLPQEKKILDVGTGSGCISLAIKKNMPEYEVHSCDISKAALKVAERNNAAQKLNVKFHQLDFLSEKDRNKLPLFDIIISNPPYVPEKDKITMSANVLQYEPSLALFVDNADPLIFYKAIVAFSKTHLNKDGMIYLEIHEEMAGASMQMLKENGFTNIELRKDLQGRDRMIKAGLKV